MQASRSPWTLWLKELTRSSRPGPPQADQQNVYKSWGKGRYDPRYNVDGMNGPVLSPPAYGLKDSPHATYTGDGDIRYWNNYVAVTQMGGQGTFVDARIGVNKTLPPGTEDPSDFMSYDYHSSEIYGFAYRALKRRMAVIGVDVPPPEELMPGPIASAEEARDAGMPV